MLVLLDYNECNPSNLVHIQDCHEKANCTNVLSTYTCVCKEGYYGNGTICTGNPNPNKLRNNVVETFKKFQCFLQSFQARLKIPVFLLTFHPFW